MRIPRAYLDARLETGALTPLDVRAHHHLINVLRLSSNDPVIVFNGAGGEYDATLANVTRKTAYALPHAFRDTERESTFKIRLLQGISKTDHMDHTLQKAVELGVRSIVPVFTERSSGKMPAERLAKKVRHWRGILVSACEQCGRNTLPELGIPQHIKDIAPLPEGILGIVLAPGSTATLTQLRPDQDLSILIGAEGGLTADEIELASDRNFIPVRLGPRILRTETAGLAVMSIAQMLWGDLGR